ncbi:ATP-NAD kinase-like domain-containing protein [Syncephalis plumigaleata]|nr:ATP-NAD kinase-like domain-containing protein [Syncephalis plumigaleata]
MTDDNKAMSETASNEETIQNDNNSDIVNNEKDTQVSEDTTVADIPSTNSNSSSSGSNSKVEDINIDTVNTINDVNLIRQSEHVTSWWKGGGTRSLMGTLQLTRQTTLTHDKKDRRTVAFLNWSHNDSDNNNDMDTVKSVSGTMRIRRALTIRKKQKENRVIKIPLERCYAVHRTTAAILPDVYQGSSPNDGGGNSSLTALMAAKYIIPIEGVDTVETFAERLASITQEWTTQKQEMTQDKQGNDSLHLVSIFGLEQNGLKSRNRIWTFAFPNEVMATAWTLWLRQEIYGNNGISSRQHLLAILNPFGGTKNAKRIYHQIVEPMAQLAGITITLVETERAKHATEFVQQLDLTLYDGLLSISGDGLYHEIINGLLSRKDWQVARQFPIGIIPAGSGNAMAVSVDQPTPELATAAAICGRVSPMDIMAITSLATQKVYYSHEMVTWSLVADIDIEADRYRWAGPVRFTMSAVWRILSLRRYKARIHYLLHEKDPASNGESVVTRSATSHHENEDINTTTPDTSIHGPSLKHTKFCHDKDVNDPLTLPNKWNSYEGPVAHFMASSLPWISSDTYIAPTAGISSGHIDLIWLAEPDHGLQLLPVLADDGRGDYLKSSRTRWHQVHAVILEPLGRVRDPNLQGIMDVDGEVVACESLAIECLPGLASMIVPKWFDEAKVARRT